MINLLPPSKLADMRLAYTNTVLRRYAELLLVGSIFLIAAFVAARYFLVAQKENSQQTLAVNTAQIAKLQPVQKEAEQLSATVNTISALLSKDVKFSEILTKIGGLMPPGSVLTGLQFSIEDFESPLVISAQVNNEQTAAVLRNNLATSELFSSAEIQTIAALQKDGEADVGTYGYTATINAYLKKTEEKKR